MSDSDCRLRFVGSEMMRIVRQRLLFTPKDFIEESQMSTARLTQPAKPPNGSARKGANSAANATPVIEKNSPPPQGAPILLSDQVWLALCPLPPSDVPETYKSMAKKLFGLLSSAIGAAIPDDVKVLRALVAKNEHSLTTVGRSLYGVRPRGARIRAGLQLCSRAEGIADRSARRPPDL